MDIYVSSSFNIVSSSSSFITYTDAIVHNIM